MPRPVWIADLTTSGHVVACDQDGAVFDATSPFDFAELAAAAGALVWTEGTELQIGLAELAIDRGLEIDVILGRGDGINMSLRAVLVGKATIVDRTMLLPDSGLRAILGELRIEPMPKADSVFEAEARIAVLHAAMDEWQGRITNVALLQPKISVGATAAGIIPRTWRKAAQLLQRNEDWQWVRGAYYGGRIQCYRPGFEGNATEYDLRAAYGWSLSLQLPDWKLYDRGTYLPVQDPVWLECTVDVSGEPGPLPVRADDDSLSWPTSGRWRGVWTRMDLEQDGVQVVEIHKARAGRWSDDLRRPVSRWLELRELTDSKVDRVLLRLLCCSVAGKLCQRPLTWKLWRSAYEPPEGAQPLAIDRPVFAIPSIPLRWPFTCPQTGSYVTARVRRKVRPALQDPRCIYTDTDSAHYPADIDPPLTCGPAAGQWAKKESGHAVYGGVRQYRIADKTVGSVVLRR